MTPEKCLKCKYAEQEKELHLVYCGYDGPCCPYVKGIITDENDYEESDKRKTTHEDLRV